MARDEEAGLQAWFAEYTATLASSLGHADRVKPFADHCVGLLSADGRKSVKPLAPVTTLERTAAQQSLLHFVAQASWSDRKRQPAAADIVRAMKGSLGYVVACQGSRASILLMG